MVNGNVTNFVSEMVRISSVCFPLCEREFLLCLDIEPNKKVMGWDGGAVDSTAVTSWVNIR